MTKEYDAFEVGEALDAYLKDETAGRPSADAPDPVPSEPISSDSEDTLIELTEVEDDKLVLEKDASPDIPELPPVQSGDTRTTADLPESGSPSDPAEGIPKRREPPPPAPPVIGFRKDVPEALAREALVDPVGDSVFPYPDDAPEAVLDDLEPETETSASPETGLAGVHEALNRLNQAFESKLKYDKHKETIIDKLHEELQSYRDGLVDRYMESLIMDFVKVIDDIRKMVRHYQNRDLVEADATKLLRMLEDIPSDLEDIFSLRGVRAFTYENDLFDPSRQRIVKKIETDDPESDRKVAGTVRPGYERDGHVLRPEMVTVYMTRTQMVPPQNSAKENG